MSKIVYSVLAGISAILMVVLFPKSLILVLILFILGLGLID